MSQSSPQPPPLGHVPNFYFLDALRLAQERAQADPNKLVGDQVFTVQELLLVAIYTELRKLTKERDE